MPFHQVALFACVTACTVYYVKATFGSGIGDAVLEIPMSATNDSNTLEISYRISSPKVQLVVLQKKDGNTEVGGVRTYADQDHFNDWNLFSVSLDSDVEAIELVAKKTGVTKNAEYVIVNDLVYMYVNETTGNSISSRHYCTINLVYSVYTAWRYIT